MKAPFSLVFAILSCALLFAAFTSRGNAVTTFEFPVENPPGNKYWSSGEGAPFGNKLKITVEEGEVLAVTANEIIINRRKAKIKIEAIPLGGWKYDFDKNSPFEAGTFVIDFSKEGVKKELAICTFYQDHEDSEEGNEQDKKVERIHAYLRVADLSVDSLNKHPYGGNDRSDDADTGENPAAGGTEPGKIIFTNSNTTAAPDGRPGWADFAGRSGKETNFAHMDLFLQAFPDGTLVRFIYSGSNPAEVKKEEDGTWFLPEGHMRIWTKHGNQTRKPQAFTEGDYIPPSTEFSLKRLKPTDQGDGHYVFFVESVRGSTQTADQTIKVQVKLPGGNWIDIDTVAFTLLQIEMTWESVGENNNISDNKTLVATNLYGTKILANSWMPAKGKRIYPDKRTPSDSTSRNKAKLKVKIPGLTGWTVYVKAFDVDDPTPDAFDRNENGERVVDPTDQGGEKGDDNRNDPQENPKVGKFTSTSTNTASAQLNAQFEAEFEFQMGMQPGNNYRVAVAVFKQADLNVLQVGDKAANGYVSAISDEQVKGFHGALSPTLTVWRTLHIEQDSMEQIPVTGAEKNFETGVIDTVTSLGSNRYSLNLSVQLSGPNNRFENGRLYVDGWLFKVISSNHLLFFDEDVEVEDDAGGHLAAMHAANNLVGQNFIAFDDDDKLLPPFFVPPLPRYGLVNDTVKGLYVPAYINVEEANPSLNTRPSLPFKRNLAQNYDFDFLSGNKDVADSTGFWAHLVVSAYQPWETDSRDPTTDSALLGITEDTKILGFGTNRPRVSVVYVEMIRELREANLLISDALKEKMLRETFDAVTAHEIGHVPSQQTELEDHGESGLMQAGANDLQFPFKASTIDRFRDASRWSGGVE